MTQQQAQWGNRAATWIATGFGVGRAPIAPGTFGTLLAIPFYSLLRELPASFYAAAVLLMFAAGVGLCHAAERRLGRHDHGAIVWDEIVGYLIAMWLAPPGWPWIVAGFVLFRLFDIWKPFPIRRLERWRGGLGVMADDALAGVYALAVLQAGAWVVAR